ncbi:MAG: 16S rRNA (uracil(1498)-N(3))-methyltransferase [Clostridiales bacterium]|nr:16S rRNA (uracil(1498)-N(3))-methyltransferase [Clostridiales bacterium]
MHRFFADKAAVGGTVIELTNKDDIGHISRVLRLGPGDRILVCDQEGWDYTCVLEEVGRQAVTARIEDRQKNTAEPALQITLYQGVPKGGKLDVTVQKCIELGVTRIVPVFMKRSVRADKGTFGKKADRLRAIAEAAAKQSGRGIIPAVEEAIGFSDMMEEAAGCPLVLFPYENEDGTTMRDALLQAREAGVFKEGTRTELAVVIGPEGGFADEEAEALKALENCRCVSLGKRILRTETAGMAALAMILYEFEL